MITLKIKYSENRPKNSFEKTTMPSEPLQLDIAQVLKTPTNEPQNIKLFQNIK